MACGGCEARKTARSLRPHDPQTAPQSEDAQTGIHRRGRGMAKIRLCILTFTNLLLLLHVLGPADSKPEDWQVVVNRRSRETIWSSPAGIPISCLARRCQRFRLVAGAGRTSGHELGMRGVGRNFSKRYG